jgi:hypothetical protein
MPDRRDRTRPYHRARQGTVGGVLLSARSEKPNDRGTSDACALGFVRETPPRADLTPATPMRANRLNRSGHSERLGQWSVIC